MACTVNFFEICRFYILHLFLGAIDKFDFKDAPELLKSLYANIEVSSP